MNDETIKQAQAPAPAAPAAVPLPDEVKFVLSSPIPAFDKMVSELTLRRPTGMDLIEIGNPVMMNPYVDPPLIIHDMRKVAAMVERLADLPAGSSWKLGSADLVRLAWRLTPFFIGS